MANNKVQLADGTVLIDLTSDTVTASDILSGKTAHDRSGASITGTIPTQAAQTITPTTSNQTIPAGKYLSGDQNILGDANLIAGNIKKDVTIFGVTGTHDGGVSVYSVEHSDNTQSIYITDPSSDVPRLQDATFTANGTYTAPSGYEGFGQVIVNVPSGGGKAYQVYLGQATVTSTSYTATEITLTVAKTGTYNVSWTGWRNTSSGTSGSQLYINGSAYGTADTSFQNTYGHRVSLSSVSLTAGQVITVYARARSTSYVMGVANLIIQEV